ncbi:SufS family cysteine desulfurase [Colwellia sp. 1_MG-2023]|uniref:SufS family cysteine desulfurase n=1 Tax=unclassified Colwellia TaxID=196834 RepID=UPI001C08DFB6|nr:MULTISPECIES: SufS family cysteine desulfurase [unclassified Colwellia]MBU2924465.1 SufS family cysteine desulfurase [Colwellia sp. C2M11]MDO6654080.1 SufS family cysteine desulfurase [Colwellia sp. 3_MG-2023]MDO6667124.1 SufS family cysteine desulfurase [Colwellia sp. 2_MG-2023]MDO6691496.1 SufS family cysteine desulfurase [Colwellia sp. 1_MG-2023]
MKNFEPEQFRQHFPLIYTNKHINSEGESHPSIIYFDNGATTQKPNTVIECLPAFYQNINANVHRASHKLSAKATLAFEQARETVKAFINAKSNKEIIWTKGTTESINLLASSLGRKVLGLGDEIILAVSEHHANIVPWQIIAEQTGASIKVLSLDAAGRVDLNKFDKLLTKQTKIVCCAHVSNVIGKINPIADMITKAKTVGAITVIDGAQAIAHFPIDVQELNCDFYVFSAHKMYGPTGVGVLYGKEALLEMMPPYQSGGEMIKSVSLDKPTTFNSLPFKFEAGTPNIAGVVAFAEAIHFINQFNHDDITKYEQQLAQYCYQALKQVPSVKFIVENAPDIPVIAFTVEGQHNHDIATSLDSYGVAIRSGHHCAMPLMEYLHVSGCLRVSLAAYNTFDEIDYFIKTLIKVIYQEKQNVLVEEYQKKPLIQHTQSTEIKNKFSTIKSWDSRHREIMLLGKTLQRMDKSLRNEQSLISGCESLAWLIANKNSQGLFSFQADSDAKIIRGLLVIVLSAFNDKSALEIKTFDIEEFFESLGLLQHLSPSRGNGVLAIVDKIKTLTQ